MFIPYPFDVITYSGREKLNGVNYDAVCELLELVDEYEASKQSGKASQEKKFDFLEKILEVVEKMDSCPKKSDN